MELNDKQPATPPKEAPVNLDRYEDLEGLTVNRLEFGLWFIEHKGLFFKMLLVTLGVIGGLSWIYTLASFGYYFGFGVNQDNKMLSELVSTQSFNHQNVVQVVAHDLETTSVNIVEAGMSRGAMRFDFYTQVRNTNLKHWGEFDYSFIVDGQEILNQRGFILPNEGKYLLGLGQEFSSRPGSARIKINRLSWHRVNVRVIPDWQSYREQRMKIEVSDSKYTAPRLTGLSEKINVGQLDFFATNNTAYNYWQTDFTILLYVYGQVVGVDKYNLQKFKSGEKRDVSISWPGSLSRVDQIEIIPEIDITDENNYFKFEAEGINSSDTPVSQ